MIKESLKGYVKAVNKQTGAELNIEDYIALHERESKELGISLDESLESEQDFELIDKEKIIDDLAKEIEDIAEGGYDWLVVDDRYNNNPRVWGSNASYDTLKTGGGKVAIIDTEQISQDDVLVDGNSTLSGGDESEYVSVQELAELIYKYWNR